MLSLRNFQQACLSFGVRQLGNKQTQSWAGLCRRCYHETILPPIKRKRYAGGERGVIVIVCHIMLLLPYNTAVRHPGSDGVTRDWETEIMK